MPVSVKELLRQKNGPLTRDLLLAPGRFGLGRVPERLRPNGVATCVCGFCSTGCALDVHLRDGEAINLSPAARYPVNLGMACPKGWEALAPLKSDDRATTPLIRRDGKLQPATWPQALEAFASGFKAIQARHGRGSVAWLGTGQIVTEELALLGAVAKLGMGFLHGDGNTRQCMATAATAYKQSFGFDAPPFTYADFEASDVIVLVGSNLCIAHPIMWERICRNPNKPAIVVVDPRKTETATAATQHLAPRPKSDLTLLYGLARMLLERGWIDRAFVDAHTTGFDELAAHLEGYDAERVAADTGVPRAELEKLAETIHRGQRVSFWWTMGVNQSHEGVRVAQAIINLALLTGNIGRPGTGANSITGQCNAMGSRLWSNTTNLFGGRAFGSPTDRREVARLLGVPEPAIPTQDSLAYDQIIDGVRAGEIRGLWVIATNPAHSWIDQQDLLETFGRLELLVVQDMYTTTETAALADIVLPAAGWGEKEGTFINSERRIGLTRKVARAPGQALADFHIFRLVAEAWGCADMFSEWETPEAVFQIVKRLSRGRPCDITGIDGYDTLDGLGGVQWPCPEGTRLDAQREQGGESANERRLFADGRFFTPDGRARLLFEAPRALPEPTSPEFPLTLLTGRGSSSQWHTLTRTAKSSVLRKLAPADDYVEINPDDAAPLGIATNDEVRVASRRAEIVLRAFVTRSVRAGELFVPMHGPKVNKLTLASFDPYSRQPSYKACAVRLSPFVNVAYRAGQEQVATRFTDARSARKIPETSPGEE